MSYLAVETIMGVGGESLVGAVSEAANGSALLKELNYASLIGTLRHYKFEGIQ